MLNEQLPARSAAEARHLWAGLAIGFSAALGLGWAVRLPIAGCASTIGLEQARNLMSTFGQGIMGVWVVLVSGLAYCEIGLRDIGLKHDPIIGAGGTQAARPEAWSAVGMRLGDVVADDAFVTFLGENDSLGAKASAIASAIDSAKERCQHIDAKTAKNAVRCIDAFRLGATAVQANMPTGRFRTAVDKVLGVLPEARALWCAASAASITATVGTRISGVRSWMYVASGVGAGEVVVCFSPDPLLNAGAGELRTIQAGPVWLYVWLCVASIGIVAGALKRAARLLWQIREESIG